MHSRFLPVYTHQKLYVLPLVNLALIPCLVDGPVRQLTLVEPPTMEQLWGREMARMSRESAAVSVELTGEAVAAAASRDASASESFILAREKVWLVGWGFGATFLDVVGMAVLFMQQDP